MLVKLVVLLPDAPPWVIVSSWGTIFYPGPLNTNLLYPPPAPGPNIVGLLVLLLKHVGFRIYFLSYTNLLIELQLYTMIM